MGLDLREKNDLSRLGAFGLEVQAEYCAWCIERAQAGALPPGPLGIAGDRDTGVDG